MKTTKSMTVIHIGYGAFSGCSGLSNILIGNSVMTINSQAFRGTALTDFILPDSVAEIADGNFYSAFWNCHKQLRVAYKKKTYYAEYKGNWLSERMYDMPQAFYSAVNRK